MKIPVLFTALTLSSFFAHAQYYLFKTTFTCQSDKKELVMAGHEKIKAALEALEREGKLPAFGERTDDKKDKIQLVYYLPSENDKRFQEISEEWKKRVKASYPDFAMFMQACPTRKDTVNTKTRFVYPVVKEIPSQVALIEGIDEIPDPKLDYKIVLNFSAFSMVEGQGDKMDSAAVNEGLTGIGRIINLHVAAGIPKEKIHIVAAVHGTATRSFLTNEAYRKKYKIDNPNLAIIEELNNAGVTFIVCGQTMTWMGYTREMLAPKIKMSLTAQTTMSSYQLKGYAFREMD